MKKILLVCLLLILASCGSEKDSDKIGNAQICLDKLGASASASEVDACLAKIDGIEAAAAYGLRCAGSFMKEGFLDASKLVNAISQLDGGSTASFMGLITFTSAGDIATDTANGYKAFTYCLKGEGKSSTLLASFGYIAMAMYNYMETAATTCNDTPGATGYDFSGCATAYGVWTAANLGSPLAATELINPVAADASVISVQSGIGAVLISTKNISCTGRNGNESLCTIINNAITAAGGTSNPRTVATKFLQTLLGL